MLLGLSEILAPLSLESFLAEFWGRRSLRGQCPSIAELTTAEDLLSELGRAHQQGIDLAGDLRGMMQRKTDETGEDSFATFVRHVHPSDVEALLESGLNLNIRRAERFGQSISSLVKAITGELGPGTVVRADAFVHRCSGGGLPRHFDSMSVLVLQVSGRKAWSLQPHVSLPFPLTSAKASGWDSSAGQVHALLPPPVVPAMEDFQLSAGEWVFVPAGAWHCTRAQEAGLSINIIFSHQRLWNWLAERCAERFGTAPSWRSLPVASTVPLRDLLANCVEDLQAWIHELDAQGDG